MSRRKIFFICENPQNIGDFLLLLQNLEATSGRDARRIALQYEGVAPEIKRQLEARNVEFVKEGHHARFFASCWGADVIVGGGQIVRDNLHPKWLIIILFGFLLTRISGGRIKSHGIGVSNIQDIKLKIAWGAILSLFDEVLVRDRSSFENVSKLVSKSRVRVVADMAFLPTEETRKLWGVSSIVSSQPEVILIAPCIDATEGRGMGGDALGILIQEVIQIFPSAEIVLLCHDLRTGMDERSARLIVDDFKLHGAKIVKLTDIDDIFSLYRRACIVITNRLHAAIFSLLANRPLLVWSDNTGKLNDLCDNFGIDKVRAGDSRDRILDTLSLSLNFDRDFRDKKVQASRELARENLG